MYYSGWDLAPDYVEAAKWYRKAGEQGHVNAQLLLGIHYYWNKAEQNYAEAAKWFRKAAEQGDAEAAERLIELHSKSSE